MEAALAFLLVLVQNGVLIFLGAAFNAAVATGLLLASRRSRRLADEGWKEIYAHYHRMLGLMSRRQRSCHRSIKREYRAFNRYAMQREIDYALRRSAPAPPYEA